MSSNLKSALFLTRDCPFPARGGGKLRDTQLIQLLSEKMPVEVLCLESSAQSLRQIEAPAGTQLTRVLSDNAPLWKRVIRPIRPQVLQERCPAMERALRERAEPGRLLWISRLAMGPYVPFARSLGYRVILDEHSVESSQLMNRAVSSMRLWPSTLLAAQCAWYEERYCENSNAVVASSDLDARRLTRLASKAQVHVIPYAVDSTAYSELRSSQGTTLFFPGSLDIRANIEGLQWFALEVMPRLRAALGSEMPRVVVAGANPSDELLIRMGNAGIEVRPNPESMLPLLQEAAVVFIPIRTGGGTRLKILEAMAAGRSVVSTGKGAEGLVLAPSYDVCIADRVDTFTSAILRLLRDPMARATMGANAARTVEERYDWRCARPMLERLLAQLAPPQPASVE